MGEEEYEREEVRGGYQGGIYIRREGERQPGRKGEREATKGGIEVASELMMMDVLMRGES